MSEILRGHVSKKAPLNVDVDPKTKLSFIKFLSSCCYNSSSSMLILSLPTYRLTASPLEVSNPLWGKKIFLKWQVLRFSTFF